MSSSGEQEKTTTNNSTTSTPATETTSLLLQNNNKSCITYIQENYKTIGWFIVSVTAIVYFTKDYTSNLLFKEQYKQQQYHQSNTTSQLLLFPNDFVWGVATSAYQIEGGVNDDGRGQTIWDTFVRLPNTILDNSTGDIADDHYHLWKQDISLMKSLNVTAYRFSISWSRILPKGRGEINIVGIQFYNQLIDELLVNNIEPWITLFHWDLPQSLQDDFDGWLNTQTIDAFVDYARIVFEHYGHKVKNFITLNEPWTFAVNGHGSGIHAPGRNENSTIEPYIVGHNLLLAHAKTYRMYQREFATIYGGKIGIANCGDYRYPKTNNNRTVDIEAAERAMMFQFGWFTEPLLYGQYPKIMKQRLKHRLPTFTQTEYEMIKGSTDFIGLNYYSSLLASKPKNEATYGGYWADIHVDFSDDPSWDKNDMGWNIVPDGLYEMLNWITDRYNNPLIYITENGSAEHEPDEVSAIHDEKRRLYFEGHITACAKSIIQNGINLGGYFAWSLMDNFEWQFGYQRRFGLVRVNFDTLERIPKGSALWYRDTIKNNGQNLVSKVSMKQQSGDDNNRRYLKQVQQREIPEKVLIGYGSNCSAVRKAVHNGVNVVIWYFVDVRAVVDITSINTINNERSIAEISDTSNDEAFNNSTNINASFRTNLNLTDVRNLIDELKTTGYGHVLHIASVGGWNGAHLDPNVSASTWYRTFQDATNNMFDGIDWDLEGNDDMISPYNIFTIDCLEKMGEISRLAKQDGLVVGMAPPQSYLDVDSNHFSRYVNLTNDSINNANFSYYGANVYAYILHKYGSYIDLISVQFYESYSRATNSIRQKSMSPSQYLVKYVDLLQNGTFYVDFEDDPSMNMTGQLIELPLNKLVLGFANGWCVNSDKTEYIPPVEIGLAWLILQSKGLETPRGFMFWSIEEEGSHGIELAPDLRRYLDTNSSVMS